MGDAEYIMIIVILLVIITALSCAVVYLCRVVFRIEEKLSDLDLTIHFATDNYLLNERKKQRDSDRAELAG